MLIVSMMDDICEGICACISVCRGAEAGAWRPPPNTIAPCMLKGLAFSLPCPCPAAAVASSAMVLPKTRAWAESAKSAEMGRSCNPHTAAASPRNALRDQRQMLLSSARNFLAIKQPRRSTATRDTDPHAPGCFSTRCGARP